MNNKEQGQPKGPKYTIDIEGTSYPWDKDTITTEEIASLGGWEATVGVIEIDKDNNERTLQPGEVVQLKPGLGFSKKIRWKRGYVLEERLDRELQILQGKYPGAIRNGMWFLVPEYPLPSGWSHDKVSVVAYLRAGYPGTGPYGIYIPQELRHDNQLPESYRNVAELQPPFGGTWAFLSWEAEQWFATAEPQGGHNILTWVDGFAARFRQGR
jgi:hypothetical protein